MRQEVEVFSNDVKVQCDNCGFTVYNDIESCIQWCKYAKACVGEELYKKLKRIRIAFIGVENTVRSVLAEALAKGINTSPKLGFVSAGIYPAEKANSEAVEVLAEENITWRGKPKEMLRIGIPDIYVLMGPEIELPEEFANKAEVIRWDIPAYRGTGTDELKNLTALIKKKVSVLIGEVCQDA